MTERERELLTEWMESQLAFNYMVVLIVFNQSSEEVRKILDRMNQIISAIGG